jgi:hypothetical protein
MQAMNYTICGSVVASSELYQKPRAVYRPCNTVSKHLEGAGWRIKDGLIPILVRGPKNPVLLHPGDQGSALHP